jgi:excisionase family DNA binding protein
MSGGLLSTAELCQVLGCHEETAYRRGRRGEWPCYRIGPEYRWRLEEVLKAMRCEAERRQEPHPVASSGNITTSQGRDPQPAASERRGT